MPLTIKQRAEMRRVAEAATPGKRTIQNRRDCCDEYESFLMPLNWHIPEKMRDEDIEYELAMDPVDVISLLDQLADREREVSELREALVILFSKCSHCDEPATCFGKYADNDEGYACDSCCGHGCEDGHCESVHETARRLLEPKR
jgi:hypothetical protein